MRFIDLSRQQESIRDEIESRIKAVLDHGQYVMGPEIEVLEAELAKYTGARHAIACASGTDALLLALMAYGAGPGDAVVTTPFTFMATAEAIALVGAVPIFVDIDPATFNIDPALIEPVLESIENGEHPAVKTRPGHALAVRGIIGVDLFGLPADYSRINDIARRHGLFVIEDAAQSFGAECFGKKACSLAEVGCTSFFPAKPLGAYGDGGMCFTSDDALADAIRSLRMHGQGSNRYEHMRIGTNGRLDTIQAAVLLAKFGIFPGELELRRMRAEKYAELLGGDGSPVLCPKMPGGCRSAWAQYSVLAKKTFERSVLLENLKDAGIPTAIYYPTPLHLQKAFAGLGHARGDFPVSEDCAGKIFSLPMHPYLEDPDQEKIAAVLKASLQAEKPLS